MTETIIDFDIEDPSTQNTITPVYDAALAKAELAARFKSVVDRMAQTAEQLQIVDAATNSLAVALAAQAKAIANKIEKQRKLLVEEPNAYVKAVNGFAKIYTSSLATIEQELKTKISEYQTEQRRINLERQRKIEEQTKALQESIASEGGDPMIVPSVIPSTQTVTRTESGTAYLRTEWKWVLKDFSKVPDRFKRLNEAEINLCVKAGVRHIEGLEIFEVANTVIRANALDDEKF